MKKYEYEFVRLSLGAVTEPDYKKTIAEYAEKGWRLNQIFAKPTGWIFQGVHHVELIFERKLDE